MKNNFRRFLAVLLTALTLCSFSAAAEAADYRYPSDQYFEADTSLTKGYAVQISASKDYNGAVKRRDKMLALGYDCYIYYLDSNYRIMCGKFRDTGAAEHYMDHICANTDRDHAYLTNVYLPDWAYEEFASIFKTDPFNTQGQPFTAWEDPTGPFYDSNQAASTKTVFTVQVSAGTEFYREEAHRDALIACGYDSFVYKYDGSYKVMSGMFETRAEAELRCKSIKTYTDQKDAFVTQAAIPTSYVNVRPERDQEATYRVYAPLLQDFSWARQYLPRDQATKLQSNAGRELQYVYYVCDVDGNGVDELLIVDVLSIYDGAWALFTCERNSAVLLAWGYTFSIPTVSVCQERGVLSLQSIYQENSVCELYYLQDGRLTDIRSASSNSASTIVQPADVDRNASGYYMRLSGNLADDTGRLTGVGTGSGKRSGYTHDGVLDSAKKAAANSSHYSTVSSSQVQLSVPADSQFYAEPFQMRTYAAKYGRAIYILPTAASDKGTLGKVSHGELVTILAEQNGYYFFVCSDGRAGWNLIDHFSSP